MSADERAGVPASMTNRDPKHSLRSIIEQMVLTTQPACCQSVAVAESLLNY